MEEFHSVSKNEYCFYSFNLDSYKTIIVLCEGDSEYAYIQELNRRIKYSKPYSHVAVFKAINISGKNWSNVELSYKKAKAKYPKSPIVIFIDQDKYIRKSEYKRSYRYFYLLNNKHIIARSVFFSKMNFEDILFLHLEKDLLYKWVNECNLNEHFTIPLDGSHHAIMFNKFCMRHRDDLPPDWPINYKKGYMPFALSEDRIMTMISNLTTEGCPIKFGLGELIKHLYEQKLIEFR